jgi:hypothetical protein
MMPALHHVGYWVDDMDAAQQHWRRDLGIGPFHVPGPRLPPGARHGQSRLLGGAHVEHESARLARLGCRLINTSRSGVISVAWHDGGPLFPHPIELHQHNDVIAGMRDRLVALRAGSDANRSAPEPARTFRGVS